MNKNNLLYLVFCSFSVFSLMSCQQQTEVIREKQSANQDGGVDQTGGGNAINGIPLDKFIVPVMEKNSYKNYVTPLLQKISIGFPRLAADFYHISQNRDWYFVPSSLSEISSKILGTYAPTDQLALQDLNKIWIDRIKFEQMTEEDQGVLIIHEIMMGIRLLKYKEKQDLCIAKATLFLLKEDNEGEENYRREKQFCRNTYPVFDGTQNTNFNLSKNDYDLIRKLVSKLLMSEIDIEEIKSLIETYKFRDYSD